jgi:hypothetical protein
MKLTKEQITYIDDYLKHHKVKYWDIRIELLDHIATTVEEKLAQGISFDDAMIEVHKSFGNSMKMFWNSGIEYGIFVNSDGYKDLIQTKREQINKQYRNEYFKEFFNLFKSVKTLSLIFLLVFIEYILFNSLSNLNFKRFNLILFLIPVVLIVLAMAIQYFKKNKSLHLEYTSFYATFSFFMLNVFVQLGNFTGFYEDISMDKNIIFSIISILNLLFCYGGIKMYLSSIKKYNNLFEKLNSL